MVLMYKLMDFPILKLENKIARIDKTYNRIMPYALFPAFFSFSPLVWVTYIIISYSFPISSSVVLLMLRVMATFPYFARFTLQQNMLLTWKEIVENKWLNNPDNPYSNNSDRIIASNFKLRALAADILDHLDIDYRQRKEKFIIMSVSPVICYLLTIVDGASL